MALGIDYAQQDCSLARALELVGERWTMLILRDCFFGVRRFTDFQTHLDISKAVLTQRLSGLVEAGLLEKTPHGARDEYTMTESGQALWPALHALTRWGEAQSSPGRPRRVFVHADCGTNLEPSGLCPHCGTTPKPGSVEMRPGPGMSSTRRSDSISAALRAPRRLLDPLRR
jgi:DNA-binding HxlR family transcriptional regulator